MSENPEQSDVEIAGLSLRPGTADDIAQLAELEAKYMPSPWTAKHFEDELEKPYSFMLVLTDDETDAKVSAYVVCRILFEDAHILNILVTPELRRQSVGRGLIQAVKREAMRKQCKSISLEVRKSNEAAVFLYQKEGFIVTQIRKQFYSNGEDAYIMGLSLEGEVRLADF